MTLPVALGIFTVLIIAMAIQRSRLVYEVAGTSVLLFGSTKIGIGLYSVFFLPGTIIHELSHWIVAEILQVRTGEITIFPDFEGRGEAQRLGSVATAKSDPFRGFLIGVAPFLTGIATLLVLGRLLEIGWGVYPFWQIGLIIYGIMVIGNSMMISKEDRRTWPFIILIILLVGIVIYRMQPTIEPGLSLQITNIITKINLVLGVTAVVNLVMIGISLVFRRAIEQLTKRRIV